ncbi:MAG: type III-A CRISPR-associated RAMP protein Csm3, partial [Bacteroidota bacterium]
KGKLRSLIARKMGYPDLNDDKGMVKKLFAGDLLKGNRSRNAKVPTRLIVRDAYVTGDFHLEDKAENWIKRLSGTAVPRHMERVTKGACFELDMVLDIYEEDDAEALLNTLNTCFQLLSYDYLGGSGSRGYGKVSFHDLKTGRLDFHEDGKLEKSGYSYAFNLMPQL